MAVSNTVDFIYVGNGILIRLPREACAILKVRCTVVLSCTYFVSIAKLFTEEGDKAKSKHQQPCQKLFAKSREHILFLSSDSVSLLFVCTKCSIRHKLQLSRSPISLPLSHFEESVYKEHEHASRDQLLTKHDIELSCDNPPELIFAVQDIAVT